MSAPEPAPSSAEEPAAAPPPSFARAALVGAVSLSALAAGFASPSIAPGIASAAGAAVDWLFSVYEILGPAVLFIALAASLAAMFMREGGAWRSAVLFGTILSRKLGALAFAILFTGLVLDLPLVREDPAGRPGGTVAAVLETLREAAANRFLWAGLLAIPTGVLARGVRFRGKGLHDLEEVIEKLGGGLQLLSPLFLFAFGAYIRGIPERLGPDLAARAIAPVEVLRGAAVLRISDAASTFHAYAVASALVFAGATAWHLLLVLYARATVPGFSVRGYFAGYFVRVYPFLFATASESLTMPLNLAMTKRFYRSHWGDAARFFVTAGSNLNVNGTVICTVIFAALCARLAGVPVSLGDLVMTAPAIFVVSLAVPGIPGELALFVDPVGAALGIPGPALASFRTLFLGFQVGLPDSARSGINSTDNCVNALLLGRALGEESAPGAREAPPR